MAYEDEKRTGQSSELTEEVKSRILKAIERELSSVAERRPRAVDGGGVYERPDGSGGTYKRPD